MVVVFGLVAWDQKIVVVGCTLVVGDNGVCGVVISWGGACQVVTKVALAVQSRK